MPSLEEIVRQLTEQTGGAAAPEAAEQEADVWSTWLRLDGSWPPFNPPAALPRALSLDALWPILWGCGPPEPPDPVELSQRTAEEDSLFPEAYGPRYRAVTPDWLEQAVASGECYASERRWQAVQNLLDTPPGGATRSATEAARLAWVQQHRARIAPLVEEARRVHFARYGRG